MAVVVGGGLVAYYFNADIFIDELYVGKTDLFGRKKRCQRRELSDIYIGENWLLFRNRDGRTAFQVYARLWTQQQVRQMYVLLGLPIPPGAASAPKPSESSLRVRHLRHQRKSTDLRGAFQAVPAAGLVLAGVLIALANPSLALVSLVIGVVGGIAWMVAAPRLWPRLFPNPATQPLPSDGLSLGRRAEIETSEPPFKEEQEIPASQRTAESAESTAPARVATNPFSRQGWILLILMGGVLLTISVIPVPIPRPWSFIVVAFYMITFLLMGTASLWVVFDHPLAGAPHLVGFRRVWNPAPRFWLLFIGALAVPAGLFLFGLVWHLSHAWAIVWSICSLAGALLVYFVGRPWAARSAANER